jgi:hypothetical protein
MNMMMQYIKKEDVKDFLEARNRLLGVMIMSFLIIMSVIYFTVAPRMYALFMDTGMVLPLLVKFSPVIAATLAIIAVLFIIRLFSIKVDEVALQQKLEKYKDGEMIMADKVLDMRNSYITIGFIGISMTLFILTFMVPLFSL